MIIEITQEICMYMIIIENHSNIMLFLWVYFKNRWYLLTYYYCVVHTDKLKKGAACARVVILDYFDNHEKTCSQTSLLTCAFKLVFEWLHQTV